MSGRNTAHDDRDNGPLPSPIKRRKLDESDRQVIERKTSELFTSCNILYTGVSTRMKENNSDSAEGEIKEYFPSNTNTATFTPQILWDDCISQRKPFVLHGIPSSCGGINCNQSLHLDEEVLLRVAGHEVVQVERRFHASETFGQSGTSCKVGTLTGKRQLDMKLQDFCRALRQKQKEGGQPEAAGEFLYLSTQEISDSDNDGNPVLAATITPPCRQLIEQKVIPQTLSWAGNLILQSCNLWMGTSQGGADTNKDGTSSGLHHDYHDNFYILLHGTKSFRLFSPDCAGFMNTFGEIHRIYPNGLISYVGCETGPDGQPMVFTSKVSQQFDEDDDSTDDEGATALFGHKTFDQLSESDTDEEINCGDHERDDFEDIIKTLSPGYSLEEQERNNFSRINLNGRSLKEMAVQENKAFAHKQKVRESLSHGSELLVPSSRQAGRL